MGSTKTGRISLYLHPVRGPKPRPATCIMCINEPSEDRPSKFDGFRRRGIIMVLDQQNEHPNSDSKIWQATHPYQPPAGANEPVHFRSSDVGRFEQIVFCPKCPLVSPEEIWSRLIPVESHQRHGNLQDAIQPGNGHD